MNWSSIFCQIILHLYCRNQYVMQSTYRNTSVETSVDRVCALQIQSTERIIQLISSRPSVTTGLLRTSPGIRCVSSILCWQTALYGATAATLQWAVRATNNGNYEASASTIIIGPPTCRPTETKDSFTTLELNWRTSRPSYAKRWLVTRTSQRPISYWLAADAMNLVA